MSPSIFSFIVRVIYTNGKLSITTQDVRTRQMCEFTSWDEFLRALQEACVTEALPSLTEKIVLLKP